MKLEMLIHVVQFWLALLNSLLLASSHSVLGGQCRWSLPSDDKAHAWKIFRECFCVHMKGLIFMCLFWKWFPEIFPGSLRKLEASFYHSPVYMYFTHDKACVAESMLSNAFLEQFFLNHMLHVLKYVSGFCVVMSWKYAISGPIPSPLGQ